MTEQASFGVLLTMRVKPGCAQRFEEAIRRVAATVADHPGNVGQAVFLDIEDELTYVISSEWVSEHAFREHERSPEHRRAIAALRDLRADSAMAVMHLVHRLTPEPGPR
ncbi:antibiotic biosynthesis monooxygenase family protein [Amycolatopsis vastitatis]|uniref:Antibiotic biosynthesis monooxygenase n=1 Tax=Amycolatopsis vastitatis TaxID=1905142 RepID=A0A229TFT7_9PSEU|nr:antibiotic biosynthesis monooxygenase family protein [Amycolatopsis vastitatis]OXM69784.1 antibiotic biosynthesis monooxygenase [Amycolatopsis vastitatis]